MNEFLQQSITYASQKSYLDDLFSVYPTIPNGIRDIDEKIWSKVEQAYNGRDNLALVRNMLQLELFPIKDSYVAYLKQDISALERNPRTVNRLAGEMYELGLGELYKRCSAPKETNRQIGPMFKKWLAKGVLGLMPVDLKDFETVEGDAVFTGSDQQMQEFASRYLGYTHNKGLDFLGRFNGRYVIGEAKFLTDFGGHQNAQLNDALGTLTSEVNADVVKIAILDGVCYIKSSNKMYKTITEEYGNYNIMSSLVLRNFLYTL